MMPDLGKYAETVLMAYAASIVLLIALIVLSIWRGRRMRAEMKQLEQRMSQDG